MAKFNTKNVPVPLDVPKTAKATYTKNFLTATKNTGNLMLFAGDQKIEHLNKDFFGGNVHPHDNTPEHLFNIASKAKIGAFATQLGLIARYGHEAPKTPYIVKLNSKTNLVSAKQSDPLSRQLWDIVDVETFKKNSGLNIVGVGYTIYLGSEYEAEMLEQAAQMIFQAHQVGLLAILWIYPRGKAITNERHPNIIAGASGTAVCLGADFVKVNYPKAQGQKSSEIFKQAILSAGRTGVICSGGESTEPKKFLETLETQMNAGARGNATGRNIHQKGLDEAIAMSNAIYAITVKGKTAKEAYQIYRKKKK